MTDSSGTRVTLHELDDETAGLVHTSAVVAVGDELAVRSALASAVGLVRPSWIDELLLQTYLFAGFPRALNAAREWRRISGVAALDDRESGDADYAMWQQRGEATCATVYGSSYEQLRVNIRHLHPTLDSWMIVEGYGKVLSRPQLDLGRRELCIIGVCAASRQDRQLHSHLHGALHAGVAATVVTGVLALIAPLVSTTDAARYSALWSRVQGK